jgi:hypothetical protein
VQRAIYLRSLTPEQVDGYLNSLNTDLTGLRELLADDTVLQELARSPLMLNIMVLAYEGVNVEDLPKANLVEEHRQQLFNTYIDRMLKRRSVEQRYSKTQTIRWLSWLAQQLLRSFQTIFLIEWIDRTWLQTRQQQWMYLILSSLFVSFILAFILAISVSFKPNWLEIWLKLWAVYSLAISLLVGAVITVEKLPSRPQPVRLVDEWSDWTDLSKTC